MTSFLKRIAIFIAIFIVLAVVQHIINFVTPYYWGNAIFQNKMEVLEEMPSIDIYYFGPSRTYRHVIPEKIDKILGKKSFNLGSPATFDPESLYLIENFIKILGEKNNASPAYAVVEVQNVNELVPENVSSYKALYHVNATNFKTGFDYFLERNDRENANMFLKAYVKYLLKSSILIPQLASSFRSNPYKLDYRDDRGYLSLDKQLQLRKATAFQARRTAFLKDTLSVHRRKEVILNEFIQPIKSCSETLIARYQDLVALGKENNVEVIFVKVPRVSGVRCIYEGINHPYKFDLSHPLKYPEFYRVEHSFDEGHFSESGAVLYSEALAEVLKKVVQ